MTTVTDVVFGAASDGSQGDTVRSAFTKVNQNVQALNDGKLETAGGTVTGGLTVNGDMSLDKPAGNYRSLLWKSAGVRRWTFEVDSAAEAGSNVGSNLALSSNTDNGNFLQTFLTFNRGTGVTTIGSGQQVNISGPLASPNAASFGGALTAAGLVKANDGLQVTGGAQMDGATVTGGLYANGGFSVTGASAFSVRPTYAGKTPWDSANLVAPVDTGTAATTKAGRTALGMGLTLIKRIKVPYSAPVTSMDFNNVFSTEFDSYEVVVNLVCVSATSVNNSINNAVGLGIRYSFDGSTLDSRAVYGCQNDYTFYNDTTMNTNGLTGVAQSYAPLGQIQGGTYTQKDDGSDIRRYAMNAFINIIEDGFGGRYSSARVNTVQNNGSNATSRLFQRWEVVHGQAAATAITPATGFSLVIPITYGTIQGVAGTVSVYGRRNGT